MDYKEKYEQALERARKVKITNTKENISAAEYIFPELRESEDEKIRKGLLEYLNEREIIEKTSDTKVKKEWVAWLEKQKPSQQMIAGAAKEAIFPDYTNINVPQKDWAEPEQKWCNSDFQTLRNCIDAIRLAKEGKTIEADYNGMINWLSSLNPQPKQEWSEEDEENIRTIVEILEDRKSEQTSVGVNIINKKIDWLKSLKPRWKPSKYQLFALRLHTHENPNLESLYDELKTLRGNDI